MISGPQDSRFEGNDLRKLYWVGGLSAVIYLLNSLFYVRGAQAHSRTARELVAWFCVLSLLPLFWTGYQAVTQSSDERLIRPLVRFAALLCLITFLTVPFHSTDVFGYVNRGWQQAHYDLNPYVYRVADVPNWRQDPMLWDHWIYNPNPYGFLFSLLARLLAWLGGGNWWLTLSLFKAVNVLAYGLTAWLVWSGARLQGHARPAVALYLFAWNPLVLVHHVANGHNDVLVGCLVALSLYLAVKQAHVWIIPVIVAATLLKYGPAVLLPFAVIFVFKEKGWRVAALGCLLGAALVVLTAAPYLKDWELLKLEDIRDNATLIDNSLHSFLIHVYGTAAGPIPFLSQFHGAVNTAIKVALRGSFVLFFFLLTFRMLKDASLGSFLEKSLLVLFALICVASSKFNAWYLGMLLPPALFLREGHWLRQLVVLISCSQLLSITFFKQAYVLNYFAMIMIPAWIVLMQVRKGKSHAEPTVEAQAAHQLPAPQKS